MRMIQMRQRDDWRSQNDAGNNDYDRLGVAPQGSRMVQIMQASAVHDLQSVTQKSINVS